jgi:hypothetical protein
MQSAGALHQQYLNIKLWGRGIPYTYESEMASSRLALRVCIAPVVILVEGEPGIRREFHWYRPAFRYLCRNGSPGTEPEDGVC